MKKYYTKILFLLFIFLNILSLFSYFFEYQKAIEIRSISLYLLIIIIPLLSYNINNKYIKDLKENKKTKIMNIILINLNLVLFSYLIYRLQDQFVFELKLVSYLMLFLSIYEINKILKSKIFEIKLNLNKTIMLVLSILLFLALIYPSIINNIASSSDNPKICLYNLQFDNNGLYSKKNTNICIYDIAIKVQNVNFCDLITDSGESITYHDTCVKTLAENINDCNLVKDKISSYYFVGCVQKIVKKTENISLCDEIDGTLFEGRANADYALKLSKDSCQNILK